MQTFLPYPDFEKSAQCLDRLRLGKQRSEVLILLRGGWQNHPAARMWQGYHYQLATYGLAVCREWLSRNYKDTCMEKILTIQRELSDTGMPAWFGIEEFHAAHRSKLLEKNPEWYTQFGWAELPGRAYVWP